MSRNSGFIKITLSVTAIFILLTGAWLAWNYYSYPCQDTSSARCIAYAQTQDIIAPQQIDLNFSFLKTPAKVTYPYIAIAKEQEGSVILGLVINAQGEVMGSFIAESSGVEVLDQAVLNSTSSYEIDLGKLAQAEFPQTKKVKITFQISESKN